MLAFRQLLDNNDDAYIVVDCPAYDAYFINYYLDFFDLPLLQLNSRGQFRPVHDADSYTRGRLGMKFDSIWVDNDAASTQLKLPLIAKGNHLPDADAEHIALHHIQIVNSV